MNPMDRGLWRHILWALAFKAVLITSLWWAFVRDQQVHVDAQSVAQALAPAPSPSSPSKKDAQP